MPRRVDIQQADDPRDVIHQAVRLLAEGQLVGFPIETSYLIAGQSLQASAAQRLSEIGEPAAAFPLALKSAAEALDYVPDMSPLGRRLSRRCWPGPVVLSFPLGGQSGLLERLPEQSRRLLVRDGRVRLRVSGSPLLQSALSLMPAPLITTPDCCQQKDVPDDAASLERRSVPAVDLIVDDGPSRYAQPATVVLVEDDRWHLAEPGVVAESTIRRLACRIILFVCTGNTCRSPMAEGLFRKLLAERLQCSEDELLERGFIIASAGLSASHGSAATLEAIEATATVGVDLAMHASQPLSDQLLDQADHVFVMTRAHRESIVSLRPDAAGRVELLSGEGVDIADPIGGTRTDYDSCLEQIERCLPSLPKRIERR